MAWVGSGWTGPPGLPQNCRLAIPAGHSSQDCRAGYPSWSSQRLLCGAALGGTGGPFHWEKPRGTPVSRAWNSWEPCRCWQDNLLLLIPLASMPEKSQVGRIPLKPQGIKCAGWKLVGQLPPDSHPVALCFTLPKPHPLSAVCVWEEPSKTPSVALLWVIFCKLTLPQLFPTSSLTNNFPLQRVPFAVGAAWEWHQKATGSSPTQSGT